MCPVPPGAPHKGDLGSGGQPAPDSGAPPAQPGASGGARTREDPSARPPRAPAPAPARGLRGPALPPHHRGMARASPDPRPPSEGCPLTPPAKAAPRESLLRAIPGRAKRRRGGPGGAAAPRPAPEPRRRAAPTAARYLSPEPQSAPLPRAAPECRRRRRGSTAFCVPVGVERSRTERQTRQPNRHRFYLAPPVQPSAAPIGGTRAGSRPITEPAGRGGAEPAPRSGAPGTPPGRAGGACARGRRGTKLPSGSSAPALCSYAEDSAPLRKWTRGLCSPKPGPRAGGGQGGVAGTGRRAGRRARGAWREPPPRSSRAGGAGRGRKPSLNQFKTRGW